jgi:cation:H+ antiporter
MVTTLLTLAGGLILLVLGGELLVRGSVQVAERLGVSPLLIGLTLVGFGTSTPELVTSVEASLIGSPGIAIGNVVGSNTANILLILGLSALVFPLAVSDSALRRDGSFVIATALLMTAAGYTLGLTRIVGLVFIAGLIAYMVYAYRQERSATTVAQQGHTAAFDKGAAIEAVDTTLHGRPGRTGLLAWFLPIIMALGGLAIIIVGGRLLVDAAITLARTFGLSESVIGLTIVAVGTSLPEFVTSIVAAVRRQTDIAVGNVLGSNIYNILGIGGLTGLIAPTAFPPDMLGGDLLVMVAASVLLFLFALNRRISRLEGAAMLAAYTAYTAWLLTRG